MNQKSKTVAVLGLLSALAIVLSIFENQMFGYINFVIPGIKPGISNITVVFALVALDFRYAAFIALIKSTASFLATGAITVLWFSLVGSALSLLGMWLIYKFTSCFTLAGISALGGVLSNVGQIIVMIIISGSMEFVYYMPVLAISGVLFGCIIGVIANYCVNKLPIKFPKKS